MRRTPNLLLTSLCGVSMALVGCSEGSRNMGDSGASQRAEYTPGTGSAMDGDDGSATGGSSQNYEPNEWGAVDATDGYAGAIDGTDGFSGSSDATDNFDAGTAPEILPPPDTSFEGVGTNPFVIAASDPQSTFAADVDTASYDIFRRDLGQWNKLPHPASVRLEEYVNFFDYDYVAPEGDDPSDYRRCCT